MSTPYTTPLPRIPRGPDGSSPAYSKSKCDGQQPVCGPCRDSGRADEVRRSCSSFVAHILTRLTLLTTHRTLTQCTWGRETAKKARTQQHFESLVNHIKSLEHRVKELEGELSQARGGHSGSASDATPSASGSYSLSPPPLPKFEPDEDDQLPDGEDDGHHSSDPDSEIEQLIAPTRHLVVRTPSLYAISFG